MSQPPDWAVTTKSDEQALTEGAYWDHSKGQAVIDFAHKFFKPQYVRGEFHLLPWQRRWILCLYCWRWPSGNRRFRFAHLHISKKNGKTLLVSLLCMYEMFFSEEQSPYIAAAAASRSNAEQVYRELRYSIERSPFAQHCKITPHLKKIEVPALNSMYCTYASQGSRVHGEATSFACLDELGQHQSPDLMRAMRYNTDARANGVVVAISTSSSPDHFYFNTYLKSKRILTNEEIDTVWFPTVYEADPHSNYSDPDSPESLNQWLAANPSLGVSYPVDQFRRDLISSKSNLGDYLNFQRLKLGIWTKTDTNVWLEMSEFESHTKDISEAQLLGCECAMGIDASECGDPTSVSLCWDLGNRNYHIKSWCWVAEEAVKKRSQGTLCRYEEFIDQGSMTVTEGDMIDSSVVLAHILMLCEKYSPSGCNFDPRGAYILGNMVENEGYATARVPPTHRYLNGPMLEFSKAWKEGRISHDGSAWLKYTLGCVRVDVNKYNEITATRKKSSDHIDGAYAALLACSSMFLSAPTPDRFDMLDTK